MEAGAKPEIVRELDPKDRELRRNGKAAAEVVSGELPHVSSGSSATLLKTDELLRQGEELFASGNYERAIHLWTRILFLERGHSEAKAAIERAKRAISERQRELEAELAAATRLLDRGDVDSASAKVESVLEVDPRISEGHQLAERIAAKRRRPDSSRSVAVAGAHTSEERDHFSPKRGLLFRVSRSATPDHPPGTSALPLKMAGFALGAILVFASGALYLHLNWESIVGDDALVAGAALEGVPDASRGTAEVPSASALRYYNGTRLYAKGRYREALAELSRVGRDDPEAEAARSLILRIEERLLRDVTQSRESSDDIVEASR